MKKIAAFLALLFFVFLSAQKHPFQDDINAFKKQDSLVLPTKDAVLFVGSSSFTKWTSLQKDFPNTPVINRAFGGSTLLDVLHYQKEVIFNYQPKKIIIYCGENDIATDENIQAKEVFKRFKKLYKNIRQHFPEIPVVYISIKPSPLRWNLREKEIQTNQSIAAFIHKKKNAHFVDIWDEMLDEKGTPKQDIFIEDHLHMNKKGYQIWIGALQIYLN